MRNIFWLVFLGLFGCSESNSETDIKEGYGFNQKRKVRRVQVLDRIDVGYTCLDIGFLENGRWFSVEQFNQKIRIHDAQGKVVEQFGKNGPGPAELNRVSDLYISDLTYNVLDRDDQSLKRLTTRDSLLIFKRLNANIRTGCFLDANTCIFQVTDVGFKLSLSRAQLHSDSFHIEEMINVNRLFAEEGSSIAFDGFLHRVKGDKFVYAPYLKNEMFLFSAKDELVERESYVHYVPEPEVMVTKTSAFPVSSTIHLADLYADEHKVYCLSRIPDESGQLVLDVYSADNLDYQFSIPIPYADKSLDDSPQNIAVYNDVLLVSYESTVQVYKIV